MDYFNKLFSEFSSQYENEIIFSGIFRKKIADLGFFNLIYLSNLYFPESLVLKHIEPTPLEIS